MFIQGGIRKPSDRLTGNLGYGVRTFWQNGWMFGGNVFFDDDFTGKNHRVGIGAEAWTDYLRLSANTYVGTTQWHTSRDFDGTWQEKPASGYDIRTEGWLPAYPQLGAKLVWEQYYGNQVALFDKNHLQHNPHAVTAGIAYTPVPLITLGVEQKQGNSQHDTQATLGLHWSLGHNLSWQTDPANVDAIRSLAGSRYELVNRNNEIVMQYRKNPDDVVTHLALTVLTDNSPADGVSRNVMQVQATNRKGQPVRNAAVSWSLVSDGSAKLMPVSSVTNDNGLATVFLSSTKAQTVPVSVLSGSASTTQNTHFATMTVGHIDLAMTQDNALADGSSEDTVVATLTDGNGKAVAGQKVTWTVPDGVTVKGGDAVSDSDGKVTVTLVSTVAGDVKVSASSGDQSADTTAHFTAVVSHLVLNVTTDNALADGSSEDTVVATLTDSNGKAVAGQKVTWTVPDGVTVKGGDAVSDSDGKVTVTLVSTVAGDVKVSASSGDQSADTTAHFTAVVSHLVLNVTTDNALADGSSEDTVVATLTDSNGKAVAGQKVTWTVPDGVTVKGGDAVSDSDGKVTVTLVSTVAGDVKVSASSGDQSADTTAHFTAVVSQLVLNVTTDNALADGSSEDTVVATLTDSNGKAVAGQKVTWTVPDGVTVKGGDAVSDSDGKVTVTLVSTVAGDVKVSASSGDQSADTTAHFTAVVSQLVLNVTTDNALADGSSEDTVVATLTDSNGKAVAGQKVTWTVPDGVTVKGGDAVSDSDGKVTVTLVSTVAGDVKVSASSGDQSADTTAHFTAQDGDDDFGTPTLSYLIKLPATTPDTLNRGYAGTEKYIVAYDGIKTGDVVTINFIFDDTSYSELTYTYTVTDKDVTKGKVALGPYSDLLNGTTGIVSTGSISATVKRGETEKTASIEGVVYATDIEQ